MKVETISLLHIKPYWRNARKNDETVEQIKQSIEAYGFNQPLVLDKDNVIITGHARYKALMQLGHDQAPCITLDISDKKAKAYRIADNKIGEQTRWNNDELVVELREIGNIEEMQTYFSNVDLSSWLDQSVGFNIKPITEDQVTKKRTDLEEKFNHEHTGFDTIELICPHCMEEYEIKKSELQ
tara:strand:+ start:1981 stop:2529 length:549 start_codon:yes stop_codon:yes gene_type:complete